MLGTIKGIVTEVRDTFKMIIKEYFGGLVEDIKNEVCKTKFCNCISYIGSMFGIITSIILISLILWYSIGMIFTFLMVGFGFVLGAVILWLWTYIVGKYNINRVLKIVSFPLALLVILGVVFLFKMILL